MPDQGPDLQPPALRQRRAAHQGDGRDPAPAGLHGRLPDDDRPGDVHHQRRRAGRRLAARPLARASTTATPRTRPAAGPCSAPRSSRTAAPGSSSRPATRTSSRSRSTASARSPRRPCSGPSATSRTTRSPALFVNVDTDPDHPYIAATLDKDLTKTQQDALIEVYKKLRPGDPPTGDNARQLVESLFFNFRRYDLGRVGRYKFDKKLDAVASRMGIDLPRDERTITREDIAAIVGHLIELTSRARSRSASGAGRPTTSTTSATAASGPTASSSRTPSGSASSGWSGSSASG